MKLLPMLMALAFASAAQAQVAPADPAPASTSTAPRAAAANPDETRKDDFRCLRHTGSIITAARNQRDEMRARGKPVKPRCAPGAGRSWSREDIERTGVTDLGTALRMLDPAVH